MRTFATASLLAVLLAGTAYADTTTVSTAKIAVPAGNIEFLASMPGDTSSLSIFRNRAVYNTAGESIGDINDLLLGPDGKITTLVVGVGGFLGMGEKNVAVPFEQLEVVQRDGTWFLTLNTNKEALAAAPTFDWSSERVNEAPKLNTTTTGANDSPDTTGGSTTLPTPPETIQ